MVTKKRGRGKHGRGKNSRLTDEQRRILANAEDAMMPAEFLMSVLRDPKADMKDKKWCAKELMPYFHRKMPVAVDLVSKNVVTTLSADKLAQMPQKDLDALLRMVSTLTVEKQEE